MADDELKLRITPEVDEDALKRAQAEIDAISGKVNLGGKGKGGGVDSALKAELASIRANIDANDLKLRKFVANSLEEENLIRKKQALNQLTAQQANTLLAQESQARENMVSETVAGYQLVEKQLASLDQANQQVINRQKQLFYAQERAQSGFSSMSRSMGTLTSSTKDANIAFANFGRIVQDAPFGLLGISNNIDPLLNSFAQLKASAGGTGAALKQMAGQLIGPAGLIFLLGSALPTALLFAQKYFKDTEKESNLAADAVKRVREEFAKLSAQAAGEKGLEQVNSELKDNQTALNAINASLQEYQANQSRILALQNQSLQQGGISQSQQAELNRLRAENANLGISQLQTDKAIIETNTSELELTKARLTAQEDITSARQRYGIATSLTAKEEEKANEERAKANKAYNDLLQRAREERQRILDIERESLYVSMLRMKSGDVSDMLPDSEFDEFEVKTESIATNVVETFKQLKLDRIAFERQFADSAVLIAQERDMKLAQLAGNRLSLGLQDERAYQQQRQLVIDEYAAQEVELARAVANEKANQMTVYADALSMGLGAIFGENKAVQSAQVVIDTIAGANKAFAGLMPNFPLAVAAAASVTAQGISALRKINSSTKKSKTLSGSGSASASVASATQKPFVTDAISPTGANIAGRIGAMNNQPQFNVTATVDRMGLALAVRDGESDISTRQIPFAS
jgi:hypothetical protein